MFKVELAKKRGDVSDFVDAVIEDDGRLQVIRNSWPRKTKTVCSWHFWKRSLGETWGP